MTTATTSTAATKRSSRKSTSRKRRRPLSSGRRLVKPEDMRLFRLVATPQVSPTGDRVVLVRKHVGEKNEWVSNLWMVDVNRRGSFGEPRQFTAGGKDSAPQWSPDGSTIAFVSGREKHQPQIATIGSAGGEATNLTSFCEGSIGEFKWSPDGSCLAVAFRERNSDWTQQAKKEREEKGLSEPPRVIDDWWYRLDGDGYFDANRFKLYIVDRKTGEHRVLYAKDNLGSFSFDFSPDSKELVVATNRHPKAMILSEKAELIRVHVSSRKITPIPNLPVGPKTNPVWSPDGTLIAYGGREGDDSEYSTENLELWVCDPKKGQARCLTGDEDYCLMAVALTDSAEVSFGAKICWQNDSKRIWIQLGWHGDTHVASIGRNGGKVKFHTTGQGAHQIGNLAASAPFMALTRGGPTQLEEVFVARVSANRIEPKRLTSFNDEVLRQLNLSKPKSTWVTSPDGTKVQTWILMPPNAAKTKKYPAILEVHGGPHAQYGVLYFHEFQVLAAAGYVVVYSNPRGSKGYGRDHCAAIRGDWGGADWVDVQSVTAWMKKQRNIDPKRVAIMGGSYGGYMTNWAIGHCHEYKAAITDRCVSNLVSMFGNSDYVDRPDHYWAGNAWDRPEARWNQSPIKYFNKVKTPTLIIHSEGDLRCNIEQAEQVFAALRLKNVPARFVRYPRSTFHGFSRNGPCDLRIHRLGQILAWYERYLR